MTLENGWRPAVEIFILAVLIYFAFRFVRGTRGWPVVIGFVVVLLALTVVTTLLDLKVLRWMLGSASVFIAFGALVIFQPELRRMLAELGNLPLFASTSEQRESIEVIIQTVERLAEVKIGALIAIEQSIQLQEAVESGIKVDCDATPEMLETIFFPNNAIHDGGVIIKGDRIAYAACIFPLTQRHGFEQVARHAPSRGDRLERGDGRRHRRGVRGERHDFLRLQGPAGAGRDAGGTARVSDFRHSAPGPHQQHRQMAARPVRGTPQARRPGGHHPPRTAPGGQTQQQMKCLLRIP